MLWFYGFLAERKFNLQLFQIDLDRKDFCIKKWNLLFYGLNGNQVFSQDFSKYIGTLGEWVFIEIIIFYRCRYLVY